MEVLNCTKKGFCIISSFSWLKFFWSHHHFFSLSLYSSLHHLASWGWLSGGAGACPCAKILAKGFSSKFNACPPCIAACSPWAIPGICIPFGIFNWYHAVSTIATVFFYLPKTRRPDATLPLASISIVKIFPGEKSFVAIEAVDTYVPPPGIVSLRFPRTDVMFLLISIINEAPEAGADKTAVK